MSDYIVAGTDVLRNGTMLPQRHTSRIYSSNIFASLFFISTPIAPSRTKSVHEKIKSSIKTSREKFSQKYIGYYIITVHRMLTIVLLAATSIPLCICRLHIILNIFYCIQIKWPRLVHGEMVEKIFGRGGRVVLCADSLTSNRAVALSHSLVHPLSVLGRPAAPARALKNATTFRWLVTDLGDGIIGMRIGLNKKGWKWKLFSTHFMLLASITVQQWVCGDRCRAQKCGNKKGSFS